VRNTKWVLEQKLGEGGFGEVWLGRHQNLKERRVFKFCFRADRVRSLKREMTLFRVLKERVGDHPNIVRLLEVNFDEPPYYLETDHVEGQDLKAWCEQQGGAEKVPLAARLEIVAQIADALQSAHDAGGVIKSGRGQTWIIRKAPSPRQAGSTVLPEPRSRQQRRTGFQPVFFTSPTSDHTRAKRHGDSDGVDTTPGIVSLKPKPYHDKTLPEGSVLPDRHGARQIGSLQMKSLGHELICHAPRIVQSQTRIGTNQSNQMLETYAGNLNSLSGDRAPACEAFDPYALGVAPIPSRFLSLPPCPAPGGRIRWR
jgi:hypothetical protein